jgi:hypothetical protein
LIVRYVTHQFAHPETLERARRWLIQAGFDPSRIEVHVHGTPRLAVAVEPGEAAEVEMLIDAAEEGDPDGFPSYWEHARNLHVYPQEPAPPAAASLPPHSSSFVVGWRPMDDTREIIQTTTDLHLREAYIERGN